MLDALTIETLIRESIPGASISIEDLRGDGEPHYAVSVISPAFEGKTRLEQHRIVYAALKGKLDFDAQPLTLQTVTP